jgi:hypothetical protein
MKTDRIAKWMREVALEKNGYALLTKQDLVAHHQHLIKIYYHAGRYAGGARDDKALEAALKLEEVLEANDAF